MPFNQAPRSSLEAKTSYAKEKKYENVQVVRVFRYFLEYEYLK